MKEKYGAAVVYLCVVQVAQDVQSTMSRDPEHLVSSPAVCRVVWDKQHPGALHTLETTHTIRYKYTKSGGGGGETYHLICHQMSDLSYFVAKST